MALPGDPERRPFVAAAFARVGLANHLVIPKNADSPEVADGIYPPSFEIARRVYLARGIAANRITILDGVSRTTHDDLQLLNEYLDGRPTESAGVVTSAFHTRRTRWTVKQRCPGNAARIRVFSAPNPGFEERTWWRDADGFRYITTEYLKLIWYWFEFGYGLHWCTGVLLLAGGWWFAAYWRKQRQAA